MALVANLERPDYVRVVCGSVDNLPTAVAKLDEQDLERTTPLPRNNRDSALFRRVQVLIKNEDKTKPNDEITIQSMRLQLIYDAIQGGGLICDRGIVLASESGSGPELFSL